MNDNTDFKVYKVKTPKVLMLSYLLVRKKV